MRGIFPLSIAFSGSHISLYWSLGLSFLFLGLNWGTGAGYASGGNLSGMTEVPRNQFVQVCNDIANIVLTLKLTPV